MILTSFEQKAFFMEEKVIDLEEGATIIGADETVAREMLAYFILSLPADVGKIKAAYRSKNIAQQENVIHRFYGGLCYVGAPKLRAAVKYLEIYLKNNTAHPLLDKLYQNLFEEIKAVEDASKSLLGAD